MVEAVANQPEKYRPASPFSKFKVADPQYILSIDPAATIEEMENALWQQIGGHELISLIRRDLIDGINPNYNIISDLERLYKEYSPKTIIPIENTSQALFNSYGIVFNRYLPSEDSLSALETSPSNPVGVEENGNTFDIYIYVADLPESYEIDVQSLSVEDIFRDTIYEGESYLS